MPRTYGGTPARRATALLTTALLSAGVLAGCSTEESPEAGPSAGTSTPSAAPSASTSPSAEPAHTAEPSGDASGRADDENDSDGDSDSDDGQDEPGEDDSEADSDESEGDGSEDGSEESAPEAGEDTEEPEEPAFIAFGETGDRVAEVQQRLQDLGYHITSVDGAYGNETQQALWALQKAGGLYRDGVVGPQTRQALDNGVAPRARSTEGKVIEIDIARQLLLAVEDGRVVRTINAASGNGEQFEARGRIYTASTPRGDFGVYNQIDGMHASTLELGNMWRPKYFNGGIAVHGASSVPPVPASHGCVRVSHDAMNWIWDTWGAPPGTRVLVY